MLLRSHTHPTFSIRSDGTAIAWFGPSKAKILLWSLDYYYLSYGEFCLNHSHLHSTVTKTLLDFVRRLRCCLEGHRIFAVFPFASCNSRPCFRRRIYGHRRLLMADRDDGERGGLTAIAPRHLLSLYIARPRLLAYAVAGRERMRLRRRLRL